MTEIDDPLRRLVSGLVRLRVPTAAALARRLIEYGERGAREVEVSLQPDRTPKQQAEWHFHQYRRFSRGSERA